jgi:hypothetical protein
MTMFYSSFGWNPFLWKLFGITADRDFGEGQHSSRIETRPWNVQNANA